MQRQKKKQRQDKIQGGPFGTAPFYCGLREKRTMRIANGYFEISQGMAFSIAQTPQGQMPEQMPQPMQYLSSDTYS